MVHPDVRTEEVRTWASMPFSGTPLRFETFGESGFVAFRAVGETNVSFIVESMHATGGPRMAPLLLALHEREGGNSFIALEPEYPLDSRQAWEQGAHVSAGPISHEMVGVPIPSEPSGGIYWQYTASREAILILTWANRADPASLSLHWLPDTKVEKIAQGTNVSLVDGTRMGGGPAHVSSKVVSLHAGDVWETGSEGSSTYAILRFSRAIGEGSLTIRDDAGTRTVSLSDPPGSPGGRIVAHLSGRVTFQLDAVGIDGLNVAIVTVDDPPDLLPAGLWHEWDQSY